MSFTKSDINDLEENFAWQDIRERMEKMLEKADVDIENQDSFYHGKAVGERSVLRVLLALPEEQRRIVGNEGKVAVKIR